MCTAALEANRSACKQHRHQQKNRDAARDGTRLRRDLCDQRAHDNSGQQASEVAGIVRDSADHAKNHVVSHKGNQAPHDALRHYTGGELTELD